MNRAALRYAKAILNLATDKNLTDKVYTEMQNISSTVKDSKELQQFLNSPTLKADAKLSVITELFKAEDSEVTNALFKLLVTNKRLNLLPNVADQFIILYDKVKGIEIATVTTAIAMTPELEEVVKNKIKDAFKKEITIKNVIDENIIGGFIIQVGDKQFDASVSGKLNSIRKQFSNADFDKK